jgi:HEAT repeats
MAKAAAEKRAEALTKALDATNDKPPEVQLAALEALQEPERQRATAVQEALEATKSQDTAVKIAAVEAIGAPGTSTTDLIWVIVVVGLLIILGGALWGTIDLLTDNRATKSPDKLITIFTTVFAGLIGLFAPSPLANRGGSRT